MHQKSIILWHTVNNNFIFPQGEEDQEHGIIVDNLSPDEESSSDESVDTTKVFHKVNILMYVNAINVYIVVILQPIWNTKF